MAINHLADIQSGRINKSNVIGIRKAINAAERRERGYSVSRTAPILSTAEVEALIRALREHTPRVTGSLHDSGVAILRSPRWRKRLESVAPVIAAPDLGFRLVRFDQVQRGHIETTQPVYCAFSSAGSFLFRNVPWQAGGNGPEIVSRESGQ